MKKNIIIISFDALSSKDFEKIKKLPNFSQYLKNASYCKSVQSVYPSLTYPAHATIISGKYPKNHGIINNTLLQPNRSTPDWYWYRKYLKGDTLYDKAIQKGMKVAALLWPVTASSKIQYNLPEIFANRFWQNQILVSLCNGSILYQYKLNKKYGHIRKGKKQPYLDDFVHHCVLHTIKEQQPNLMLVHYTDLDSHKHFYGVDSYEADEALKRHDKRLGELINILKDLDKYDNSTIILLGDHSQLNEHTAIFINSILRKKGYIKTNKKGQIIYWDVLLKNCDGSAYIYMKDKKNTQLKQEIYQLLLELQADEKMGIEHIFTTNKAIELGADPQCAFMIEAKKGFYFLDDCIQDVTKKIEAQEIGIIPHITMATHGYLPNKKDYTTVFMASGAFIKNNVEVETMELVDIAPTIAKILDIKLKEIDGKVIESFLDL